MRGEEGGVASGREEGAHSWVLVTSRAMLRALSAFVAAISAAAVARACGEGGEEGAGAARVGAT